MTRTFNARNLFQSLSLCTLLAMGLMTSPALASDALTELYGKGVHAYFAHNHTLAQELLTQAIDAGSTDSRAYYFRGLSLAAQGDAMAGLADYERGAELEVSRSRSSDIGKALQRIQGLQRLEIEKARQNARVNWKAQQQALQESRTMRSGNSGTRVTPPANFEADSMLDGNANEMKNKEAVPEIDILNPTDEGMDNKEEPDAGMDSNDDMGDFGDDAPSKDEPKKKDDADTPFGDDF